MSTLKPFDDILALGGTNFNSQASKYFASPTRWDYLDLLDQLDNLDDAKKACKIVWKFE
jgi:hypothetical protein